MNEKKQTNIFVWALFIVLATAILFLAAYVFNKQNKVGAQDAAKVQVVAPVADITEDTTEEPSDASASPVAESEDVSPEVEIVSTTTTETEEEFITEPVVPVDPNFDPLAGDVLNVPEIFEIEFAPAPE